jgi:hypothetical protein
VVPCVIKCPAGITPFGCIIFSDILLLFLTILSILLGTKLLPDGPVGPVCPFKPF